MEGALGSHYTFAPLSVEALLELKDLFDSGEKVGDNVELRDAKAGRVRQQEVLGSLKNSKLDMEHEDRMKCFENVFREISLLKKIFTWWRTRILCFAKRRWRSGWKERKMIGFKDKKGLQRKEDDEIIFFKNHFDTLPPAPWYITALYFCVL